MKTSKKIKFFFCLLIILFFSFPFYGAELNLFHQGVHGITFCEDICVYSNEIIFYPSYIDGDLEIYELNFAKNIEFRLGLLKMANNDIPKHSQVSIYKTKVENVIQIEISNSNYYKVFNYDLIKKRFDEIPVKKTQEYKLWNNISCDKLFGNTELDIYKTDKTKLLEKEFENTEICICNFQIIDTKSKKEFILTDNENNVVYFSEPHPCPIINYEYNKLFFIGTYERNIDKRFLSFDTLYVYEYKLDQDDYNSYITEDNVFLRSEPSLEGRIVGKFKKDTKLCVFTKTYKKQKIGYFEDYWYYIETETQQKGWMFGAFINIK